MTIDLWQKLSILLKLVGGVSETRIGRERTLLKEPVLPVNITQCRYCARLRQIYAVIGHFHSPHIRKHDERSE